MSEMRKETFLQTYGATAGNSVALNVVDLPIRERHIYGSSRLGMYTFEQSVKTGPVYNPWYCVGQWST